MFVRGRRACARVPGPGSAASLPNGPAGRSPRGCRASAPSTRRPSASASRRNAARSTPARGVRSTRTRPSASRMASDSWSMRKPPAPRSSAAPPASGPGGPTRCRARSVFELPVSAPPALGRPQRIRPPNHPRLRRRSSRAPPPSLLFPPSIETDSCPFPSRVLRAPRRGPARQVMASAPRISPEVSTCHPPDKFSFQWSSV